MLKVIGAGLPRTGTTSMKAAMERLGFDPCYHMYEVMTHSDHVDRWLPAVDGEKLDWESVLGGYVATMDWPASFFWREQMAAYPDAKVILTVRDPSRWFTSFRTLLGRGAQAETGEGLPADLPPEVAAVLAGMQRMRPLLERMTATLLGDGIGRAEVATLDESVAVAAFERHVARVKAEVPAERLLVFDVRQGWAPLADFLGVEAPDEPFPRLNDTETMQRNLQSLMAGGAMPTLFGDRS